MRSKGTGMRWLGFPSFAALLAACSGGGDLGPMPAGNSPPRKAELAAAIEELRR
ncbi:hypothetical protein ACMHYB_33395 [Sorangium sp. So ce1128]